MDRCNDSDVITECFERCLIHLNREGQMDNGDNAECHNTRLNAPKYRYKWDCMHYFRCVLCMLRRLAKRFFLSKRDRDVREAQDLSLQKTRREIKKLKKKASRSLDL